MHVAACWAWPLGRYETPDRTGPDVGVVALFAG